MEHVGQRSGTTYRTPLLAFRHGDTVTFVLPYGPGVQRLKNIRKAGRCSMRHRDQLLEMGAAADLSTEDGLSRMPRPIRFMFARTGAVKDFIELPVQAEQPHGAVQS